LPFRLNIDNAWTLSLLLHGGLSAILLVGAWMEFSPRATSTTVEFSVVPAKESTPSAPYAVRTREAVAPKEKARAVFGVSRKAVLSDSPSAVAVKPGNTVAKENDDETLRADDPDSLPNPVEEFLVSSMPGLVDEVRVPYPPEARKQGLQGPVVMDILIDANGKVRDAKLLSGPGPSLEQAALAAVRNFQFRPAQVQGKAVAVRIRYAYRFVLED